MCRFRFEMHFELVSSRLSLPRGWNMTAHMRRLETKLSSQLISSDMSTAAMKGVMHLPFMQKVDLRNCR